MRNTDAFSPASTVNSAARVVGRAQRPGFCTHGAWLALIVLITLYLYGGLLSGVIAMTHEGLSLYIRTQQYMDEIQSGFLQPMLFPDVLRGAGFAFPVFYPPLSYYVASWIGLALKNPIGGLNTALFLSTLLSALAAYAVTWEISRKHAVAVAATALYLTATYRFVNVYVRGDLAESWASVWYPICILGGLRILRGRPGAWIMSVGLAGLLLSHVVMAMWFVPMLAAWLMAGICAERRWSAVAPLFVSGLLGLGLAAWYLVPQQAYLDLTWVSVPGYMWAEPETIVSHRLRFSQLFELSPDRWRGLSIATEDDGMCFKLGLGQWVALAGGVVWLADAKQYRRKRAARGSWIAWAALLLWCWILWFMLKPGLFLAVLPRHFSYLQFPWRLLAITPVFAAIYFSWFAASARLRTQVLMPGCLLLCVVFVAEVPEFVHARVLKLDITAGMLDSKFAAAKGDLGTTEIAEYLPRTYPADQREKFFQQLQGRSVRILSWNRRNSGEHELTVQALHGGSVVLPLINYPFWRVVDDKGERLSVHDQMGYMALEVPPGNSVLRVKRGYTLPYYVGWTVTALSLAGCGIFHVLMRRWENGRKNARQPGRELGFPVIGV